MPGQERKKYGPPLETATRKFSRAGKHIAGNAHRSSWAVAFLTLFSINKDIYGGLVNTPKIYIIS